MTRMKYMRGSELNDVVSSVMLPCCIRLLMHADPAEQRGLFVGGSLVFERLVSRLAQHDSLYTLLASTN